MRSVLVLVLGFLTRPAFANQCDLTSPRSAVGSVAANCPLVVYVATSLRGSYAPAVSVLRGTAYVDLPVTIDESRASLEISTTTKSPDTCEESTATAPTDMTLFRIAVDGLAEGDWLRLDGGDIYVAAAAASCPTYLPTYYCDAPAGFCDGSEPTEPAGCNAVGAPGLGIALLALAIRRRRRRR